MKNTKLYYVIIELFVVSVFLILFSFWTGVMIGGNYDFTSLCLSNGCGYEATGAIGFFVGLVLAVLFVGGSLCWRWCKKVKK